MSDDKPIVLPKLRTDLTVRLHLKMEVGLDPKDQVLATEAFIARLCEASELDVGHAIMTLLMAASHLAMVHKKKDASMEQAMANFGKAIGNAVGQVEQWWPPADKLTEKRTILHS